MRVVMALPGGRVCDQFFKIERLLSKLELSVVNFGSVARHFNGLLAFTESRLPFHSLFCRH